jgi:hypothetical protein
MRARQQPPSSSAGLRLVGCDPRELHDVQLDPFELFDKQLGSNRNCPENIAAIGSDLTEIWGYRFDHFELDRGFEDSMRASGRLEVRAMFKFLGIHWAQFPETWVLRDKSSLQESRKKHLVTEGGYVEGMSGMTCVIPAWQVLEVLDMPELKNPRDEAFASAERNIRR